MRGVGFWDPGSVRLKVTGRRLEAFINLAAGRGIWLRDVRWSPGHLQCWVRAEDFRDLRPVARESGCRVQIRDRRGALFRWRALFRRRAMLIGLLLCLFLLLVSSSVVWTVEVKGLQEREPAEVIAAARRLGVAPGIPFYQFDMREVARGLERELPFVTWAALQRSGVRVIIRVVERVGDLPEPAGVVDIVASREGIVRDVLVLAGVPLVQKGDEVREGTVLIRAERADPAGEEMAARGQIMAVVWYTEKKVVRLSRGVHVPTGREHVRTLIAVGEDHSIAIAGGSEIPFSQYVTVRERRPLMAWNMVSLPLYVERLYHREMSSYRRNLSEEQAVRIACARVQHQIRTEIGPEGAVISCSCSVLQRDEEQVVVQCSVEAIESIGQERPVEPGNLEFRPDAY